MNCNLDIDGNKTWYTQVCALGGAMHLLSCLPSCYLSQKLLVFLVFNLHTAVVNSTLSLLRWHLKVICYLVGMYNVLLSASPALLSLNCPEVLVIFQLLETSSVFHRYLEIMTLRLSTTFFPHATDLLYQFLLFPCCTLTGHSVPSWYAVTTR